MAASTASISFTDLDRDIIARARELGAELRASSGDRARYSGWLLKELDAIIERLSGQPSDPGSGSAT